jgi:hypothetical protein
LGIDKRMCLENSFMLFRQLQQVRSWGVIDEMLKGSYLMSSLLTGIPSSHSHRLITPDDILIQFDLLMMSAVTLETCREV